jgi:Flp pilus assembly pilin Flp
MSRLWQDDTGAVGLEYLLTATVVGLGLVVGMAALENAHNVEFSNLGNAILALDQGYSTATQTSFGGPTHNPLQPGAVSLGVKRGSFAASTPQSVGTFVSPPVVEPPSLAVLP